MMPLRHGLFALATSAVLTGGPLHAAAPPAVRDLRVQQVAGTTYFHVRFETPRNMVQEAPRGGRWSGWGWEQVEPDLEPRLVPQDGQARAVCWRAMNVNPAQPVRPDARPGAEQPRPPATVEGLEFVGKLQGKGEGKFLLVYPTETMRPQLFGRLRPGTRRTTWAEVAVSLDFAKAQEVAVPDAAKQRKNPRKNGDKQPGQPGQPGGQPAVPPPVADDLEGLWADAQVDAFARLNAQVIDFSFYSFAAEATARKYGVPARGIADAMPGRLGNPEFGRELYETTTGAAAIAESLQLRRMNGMRGDNQKRTIDIAKVQGIDIAEHPWEKMMGENKPAPEPMARLVPQDNYYVHFKNIRTFIEFGELLDQWGTNLLRAYELNSRDYRLKERYEQQLCLKSTALGKTLGPLVIKGLAITGSDAYLREGSDVTVAFQVVNKPLFLSAVEPFIREAREKFGDRLKQDKADYKGVAVESFVTPLREVSLHRAAVDDFVIYSNSPAALHRTLDVYQGRAKSLAESPDFQYMRTVFRYDDKAEDGFAFLSDPFIRRLVGPASKIKERRRLEALTTLHMLTNGALLTAWETGKPPATQAILVGGVGLKPEELPVPEGKPAVWDPERQVAFSDAYNTLDFATPLIELAIDKITEQESQEYNRFRLEYLGLWRQYCDPIGIRIGLGDKEVKLDTYILPLVQNSRYNELRRVTGGGTVSLDPGAISSRTLFQFLMHLSPDIETRGGLLPLGRGGPGGGLDLMTILGWGLDPVGKWFVVRFDDSPVYGKLVDLLDRQAEGQPIDGEQVARLVFQMPVVIGVDIRNPLTFGGALAAARTSVLKALPGALTWEPLEKEYKGVSIVRIQATAAGRRQVLGEARARGDAFLPAVYYAMIDGAFYLTLNEPMLHEVIDHAQAAREGKAETVEVNSSLYLAPGAAEQAGAFVRRYLERQTSRQALANDPVWYLLYRTGLVPEGADAAKARDAAFHYLGFVPVSPDGAAYEYLAKTDEVVNQRHGSLRKPQTHKELADDAPLGKLLGQLRSIRADLRFREDGVHTVLTIDRKTQEK